MIHELHSSQPIGTSPLHIAHRQCVCWLSYIYIRVLCSLSYIFICTLACSLIIHIHTIIIAPAAEYSFVIEYFCQKRVVLRLHSCVIGWTWKNYELMFGQWLFTSTHTLLELWVANAVTLHCSKSERHFRSRSWGWYNLSRVKCYFQCNLLFIFISVTICSTSPQINHSIYCLRTNQFRKKQQNSPDPCQLKTKNSCR